MTGSVQELLLSVLGSLALRLPILIAVCVSLVWVLPTPRAAPRTAALLGLSLLGVATLLGMVMVVGTQVLVARGVYEVMIDLGSWLRALHFVLGLAEAFAMVLLVWAMTRALRDRSPTGGPPSRI